MLLKGETQHPCAKYDEKNKQNTCNKQETLYHYNNIHPHMYHCICYCCKTRNTHKHKSTNNAPTSHNTDSCCDNNHIVYKQKTKRKTNPTNSKTAIRKKQYTLISKPIGLRTHTSVPISQTYRQKTLFFVYECENRKSKHSQKKGSGMDTNTINKALDTLKKIDYNALYSEQYKTSIKSQLLALIERIDATTDTSNKTPVRKTDKNYVPTPRINLNVPYKANKYVKRNGAKFDSKSRTWFTYAGSHSAHKLVRFMSETDAIAYGFKSQTKAQPDTPLPPVKTKPTPKININSPAPHIRKGHWHRYWVGSGPHKQLITKWVDACKVGY